MQSLVLNMNSTLFEQLFSFARMKVCARLCSWINFTLFHSNQTLESKGKERSYLCINTFYMLCMSDVAAVAYTHDRECHGIHFVGTLAVDFDTFLYIIF